MTVTEVREMLLLDDFSDDESIHSEEEALPNDDEVNNITSSEDEIDDDEIEDMEMEGDLLLLLLNRIMRRQLKQVASKALTVTNRVL